jgi:CRP-like cAMP-binding protein
MLNCTPKSRRLFYASRWSIHTARRELEASTVAPKGILELSRSYKHIRQPGAHVCGLQRLSAHVRVGFQRVHDDVITDEVPLLRRLVDRQVSRASDLLARMERIGAPTGQVLIRAGASDGDIYFIESGRVNIQLDGPGVTPIRLRSLCSGAIVGEAARYLGRRRTADVVVHAPSVIWRLSEKAIDRLEAEDRDLAAQLHALMARSLAEKVEKTNGLLSVALARPVTSTSSSSEPWFFEPFLPADP